MAAKRVLVVEDEFLIALDIAGVLEHLPGLCGLTAPSFNSYRRIVPQYWAGAFVCWGHDNREAPVRVPSVFWGMEEASTNVELKSADASSNPWLAVGGLIAAGLDGITRQLELNESQLMLVDPATLSDEEREERGIAVADVYVRPDGRQLSALAELLAHGTLSVPIASVRPLEQAAQALREVVAGADGAIVLSLRT